MSRSYPKAKAKPSRRSAPKPASRRKPVKRRAPTEVRVFQGQSCTYRALLEAKTVVLGARMGALQIRAKAGHKLLERAGLPDGFQDRVHGVYAKLYGVGLDSPDLSQRVKAMAKHPLFAGAVDVGMGVIEEQTPVEIPTARCA